MEKLDDLLTSATKEKQLDSEKIFNQTIDFLFSEKGIVLRNELINIFASRLDSISWKTVIKINDKLPSNIRSKTIEKSSNMQHSNILNISSINKMFDTSKRKPGFKRKIIFKKLPKILITKDTYEIGFWSMKKHLKKV